MLGRVLVAVDDSSAGLAATRAAVALAAGRRAELRALHVVVDNEWDEIVRRAVGRPEPIGPGRGAGRSLLRRVVDLAHLAGVRAEVVQRYGDPAGCILAEARHWRADLVVVGRSGEWAPGEPYVGRQAQQVIELAEAPVLVVPEPSGPTVSD